MIEGYKKLAYQRANIGCWEFDVVNGQLYWSNQVKRLYEVSIDYDPDLEEAITFYPEGSHREKVRSAILGFGGIAGVAAIGESEMEDGQCVYAYMVDYKMLLSSEK